MRNILIFTVLFAGSLTLFLSFRSEQPDVASLQVSDQEAFNKREEVDVPDISSITLDPYAVTATHTLSPESIEILNGESDLQIKLLAINETGGKLSAVLLLEGSGEEKSYQVKDEIYPEVHVYEILPGTVIIDDHGKEVSLYLDMLEAVEPKYIESQGEPDISVAPEYSSELVMPIAPEENDVSTVIDETSVIETSDFPDPGSNELPIDMDEMTPTVDAMTMQPDEMANVEKVMPPEMLASEHGADPVFLPPEGTGIEGKLPLLPSDGKRKVSK